MADAWEVVADKFDELIERRNSDRQMASFTHLERAIWFIVTMRCGMDIDGFGSIFEQSMTRDEIVEAIGYLRQLELTNVAVLFERAIALLDNNDFYEPNESPYLRLVGDVDRDAFKE